MKSKGYIIMFLLSIFLIGCTEDMGIETCINDEYFDVLLIHVTSVDRVESKDYYHEDNYIWTIDHTYYNIDVIKEYQGCTGDVYHSRENPYYEDDPSMWVHPNGGITPLTEGVYMIVGYVELDDDYNINFQIIKYELITDYDMSVDFYSQRNTVKDTINNLAVEYKEYSPIPIL